MQISNIPLVLDNGELLATTPTQVANAKIAPYHFTGLIQATYKDGKTAVGTAIALATKPGQKTTNYILTCAHVLVSKTKGKATKVHFLRGLNKGKAPNGFQESTTYFYNSGYTPLPVAEDGMPVVESLEAASRSPLLDYAVVKLPKAISLDNIPSMLVQPKNKLENANVKLSGYGAATANNLSMFEYSGKILVVTDSLLATNIFAQEGDSGAGLLTDNKTVVGLVFAKLRVSPFTTIALRMTDAIQKEILGWMK